MVTQNAKAIRSSFTFLQSDLELLGKVKKRCLLLGIETHKSELIRAGIEALTKLPDSKLRYILAHLPKPKVGRKKLNLGSA